MFGKRESEDVIALREYLTSMQYNQINSALQHYSLACSNLITPSFKGDKKLIEEIIKVIASNNSDKPFHEQFDFAHQLYIDMEIESRSDKYSFLNDLNVCLANPVIAENFASIKDIYLLFENKKIVNGILDNITKNNFDENQIKLLINYLKQARKYYADERAFYSDFISILDEDITEETLNNYLFAAKLNTGIYDDEVIGSLRGEVVSLMNQLSELKGEIKLSMLENEKINEAISSSNDEMEKLDAQNKKLQGNISFLENQIKELSDENKKLKRSNEQLKTDYKEILRVIKKTLTELPANIEKLTNKQISQPYANNIIIKEKESDIVNDSDINIKEITLLQRKLLRGSVVMKKYGARAAATDAAICMGCVVNNQNPVLEGNTVIGRSSSYWLSDTFRNGTRTCGVCVTASGELRNCSSWLDFGIRPILKFDNLKDIMKNCNCYEGFNGTKEVEFGEFPQFVASKSTQEKLEQLYNDITINSTGKIYSDFGVEYELDGHKYVRSSNKNMYSAITLSDGNDYSCRSTIWLEVMPLVWLADEENNMLISKYVILNKRLFYRAENDNARFKTSKLYRSLNNDFIKDIIPSKITTEKQETYRPNTILPGETFMEMLNRETSRNKKITHDFAEALRTADAKSDSNETNVKKQKMLRKKFVSRTKRKN